jgi:pimeloyl-ACP methyl ester carboxylesterase
VGGLWAEFYAVSYDDIDALVIAGWADAAAFKPSFVPTYAGLARLGVACATGGSSKRQGGPSGWARVFSDADLDRFLYNVEPGVKRAFIASYEEDPCGIGRDVGPAAALTMALSPMVVRVPVLLIYGDHDPFVPGAYELQRARYVSSSDVALEVISDAGHGAMMARSAAGYREVMSRWLKARKF